MTSKLVRGAVAASLLGLGMTTAQAASSVVLYGLADAGPMHSKYKFSQGGTDVRVSRNGMASGTMNSSRVGIKGREDMGSGLSAIFNFEQKIDLRDGDGGDWKRQAWVGLTGKSWGTFTLGRQKDVANKTFDIQTTRALGKLSRAFGAADARYDGLLKYMTPKFGGVSGGIAYAHGNDDDDFRNFWSLGAQYENGPLMVGSSYKMNRLRTGYTVRNWGLGGTYDFKVIRLSAGYGQDKNGKFNAPGDVKRSTLDGYSPAGLGDYDTQGFKSKNYYLGAVIPAGANEFGLAWSRTSSNLGRLVGVADGTQNIFVAQYKYALSKRTFLYAYGAYAKNLAYLKSFKGQELAVGMQHRF